MNNPEEYNSEELNTHLQGDLQLSKLDKLFQIIIKSAVFELLYKTKTSTKIIIKEYLTASNSFLDLFFLEILFFDMATSRQDGFIDTS